MSDKENLTRQVAFRLSESSYSAFQQKVKASGKSQSEFFRDCVMDSQVAALDEESRAAKRRLLFLVNNATNNLNQLAKAANTANKLDFIDEETYTRILAELEHISRFMKATLHAD